ncbi:MAG TPA: glycosyltransferase family 4 protein, partial [Candidatus Dojkabacteria bacterium]|nr:glycosyltransferase family 4 protein [Candidatus Dojkabacteria bacterium]
EDAINNADSVVVLSDSAKRLLIEKYSINDSRKIKIIPHGVDFDPVDINILKGIKRANPFTEISFVGRLEKDKGIKETINAFKTLKNKKVKLNIVGDGPLHDELVEENKLNKNIVFYGYLSHEKLKDILMKSHIFCMPSTSENLPLSVIEAMYFAVTPIFTKGESVPNIFVDGIQGFLIDLHLREGRMEINQKDLQNKLEILVENPKLREELSYNAYSYALKNYSNEVMVRSLIDLYKSVISKTV